MLLYLSWKDSIGTHPDNKPYDFIVDLPKTVRLEGFWEVALTDIKVKATKKTSFYLSIDFCEESIFKGSRYPVLRRVDDKIKQYAFPHFVRVNKSELQSIRVTLVEKNLNFFPASDIDCTLILRRRNENSERIPYS